MAACIAAKKMPPPGWTQSDSDAQTITAGDLSLLGDSRQKLNHVLLCKITNDYWIDLGAQHSLGLPIHIYPLYENGFRAHRGQSIQDNNLESAQLYAEFAKVAASNPYAWRYKEPAATKEAIQTVKKENRMICFPCWYFYVVMS